jgi:glycosyltransferase involved in cell wall biosynthesis
MPTWNRRAFIPAAIDCFMRQTHENRELVILDDGETVDDLVPADPRIRYERTARVNTGVKRNLVNELADGEIICHWDDDDWSAPDRIADQVGRLVETGKPVTGYGTLLFWDTVAGQAKRYHSQIAGYVCGTSLCYTRDFWQMHRFPDKQEASDNAVVYPVLRQIAASHDVTHMVARIHDCHHTSKKVGITETVAKELIPAGFWENEKLRLES